MNKIFLYTASDEVLSVNFLFFDSTSILLNNTPGFKNINNVWEATVPPGLPPGDYTVVGTSATKTLGKEEIRWNGTEILEEAVVIAKAVRTELTPELIHLVSLDTGLTTAQATMLLEIYRLLGLDPTRPLVVTKTVRTVLPEISQILTDTGTQTTVTRILP